MIYLNEKNFQTISPKQTQFTSSHRVSQMAQKSERCLYDVFWILVLSGMSDFFYKKNYSCTAHNLICKVLNVSHYIKITKLEAGKKYC